MNPWMLGMMWMNAWAQGSESQKPEDPEAKEEYLVWELRADLKDFGVDELTRRRWQ